MFELKLDGYRAEGIRDAKGVLLLSKNGKDLSKNYPAMIAALAHALMKLTVVDGELVAVDEDGRPSFNAMQNSEPETRVVFFVFDVLIDQRIHVKGLPLSDRRSVLRSRLSSLPSDLVQQLGMFFLDPWTSSFPRCRRSARKG